MRPWLTCFFDSSNTSVVHELKICKLSFGPFRWEEWNGMRNCEENLRTIEAVCTEE